MYKGKKQRKRHKLGEMWHLCKINVRHEEVNEYVYRREKAWNEIKFIEAGEKWATVNWPGIKRGIKVQWISREMIEFFQTNKANNDQTTATTQLRISRVPTTNREQSCVA